MLNKWVFWCVARKSADLLPPSSGIAAPPSVAWVDPLIPSRDDAATVTLTLALTRTLVLTRALNPHS